MGHAMFETQNDSKANARYRRTRGRPSEEGYGNAFKVVCNRCKATVFRGDYGNTTGARYIQIWMQEAVEGHYTWQSNH